MKIAIIGSGISGLTAARELYREHEITLYEARERIGGHTHTVEVKRPEATYQVDTGFIIYNTQTYPNFCRMMDEIGVVGQHTTMGFSVKCEQTGLEYNSESLPQLFAQKRNLVSPRFWRMIKDLLRFQRTAASHLDDGRGEIPFGEYLKAEGFSEVFIEKFIVPMGSALWSSSHEQMFRFPAKFFIRFFKNHGLLTISDHPQWLVVPGGSSRYAEQLIKPFEDRIRYQSPVTAVVDEGHQVRVFTDHDEATYDAVVMACHADQALKMLKNPSAHTEQTLKAFPYQRNDVVLHTWDKLLPRKRSAWASWNYHIPEQMPELACLTYNMNILQSIQAPVTFCVTLNYPKPIPEEHVIRRLVYHHPVFTTEGVQAQQEHERLNRSGNIVYCGAYWRYGFHEDGAWSAMQAVEHLLQRPRSLEVSSESVTSTEIPPTDSPVDSAA